MSRRRTSSTPNLSFECVVDSLNELFPGGAEYRAVQFVLPVCPAPAPRPRFTRDGYAYSPKTYVTWRGQVKPHVPALRPVISDLPCALALDLVMPPYKTVNTPWPKGDIDNYAKAIFDIVTSKGCIWKDDIQVNVGLIRKRFCEDGEEPHAHVYIREVP